MIGNILRLFDILPNFFFATKEREFTHDNGIHGLLHDSSNYLKRRILENSEMSGNLKSSWN